MRPPRRPTARPISRSAFEHPCRLCLTDAFRPLFSSTALALGHLGSFVPERSASRLHRVQKLNSSSLANVFRFSLNNGHQDHSLVPIGRLFAFDHRSGFSVLKKTENFAYEPGPPVRPPSMLEIRPPPSPLVFAWIHRGHPDDLPRFAVDESIIDKTGNAVGA